jgi:hypothetical protein
MPPIQRELASASGDDARRLQRLLAWVADHHVQAANADLDDEFERWIATATMAHGGSGIPVRKLPGLVHSTEDRPTRREYAELRAEALFEVLPLQLDRLNRWRIATKEVGFGDHGQSMQRLYGLSLKGIEREGRRFLEATEDAYREHLGRHLVDHIGLAAVDAEAHDAEWLNRQKWLDGLIDEATCLETVGEDLRAIGLPLEADGRIELTVEPFPSAGMRPACMAVRVPDRVLVLVTPTTSVPGIRTLMREIGRGMHWAYTEPRLPFEFRSLGDASVVDAHATLFGGLGRSATWVRRVTGLEGEPLAAFVRIAAFLELFAVRQMVGRLVFDLELAESDRPGAMGPRWAEIMLEATGFRHDPREYLSGLGQRFGVARRLRARMLAALLTAELEWRFDEDWYRNPGSGAFLGEWFGAGLTYDAEELALKLSPDGLNADTLASSIHRRLEA